MRNHPPCEAHRQRRGFTLVEIVVAVLLLGVLSGYSFMAARNILDRAQVDRASSRLAFQLQQARSEAVATNRNMFVRIDQEDNQFISWSSDEGDQTEVPDSALIVEIGDKSRVDIRSAWTNGLFNAYGQFITTPGQREMRTVSTRFSTADGSKTIELILRGSGAVTKR